MKSHSSTKEGEIKILPPIVKTSQPPHWRRTDRVFQALDEAAAKGVSSYTDLINFVSSTTGMGCSRKLVARWKRNRAAIPPPVNSELAIVELKAADAPQAKDLDEPEQAPLPDLFNIPGWRTLILGKVKQLSNRERVPLTDNSTDRCPTLPRFNIEPGKLRVLGKTVVAAAIGIGIALAGGQSLNADQEVQSWEVIAQNTPDPSPSVSTPPTTGKSNSPKTLKLDLTITSPKDLKVRQGDTVVAGEVLADRVEERSHLTTQLQTLELEYKQVASKTIPTLPPPVQVPEVKSLPPISYEEEEAAISAAGVNVRQAERAFQLQQQSLKTPPIEESAAVQRAAVEVANRQRLVDNQKRKIDAVAMLKDLPEEVAPHEQEVLKQKEAELQQAQADYSQAQAKLSAASQAQTEKLQQLGVALEKARADQQVAIAKLQTKKDQRAYTEYEASLAAAKRAEERNFASANHLLSLQETEQRQRDREYQLAQLKTKIAEVKEQLSLVSVVTSPYSGVIKSVKVQRQTNNSLAVEITIAVGSTGVPSPGPDSTPAPTPDEPAPASIPDEPTPTLAPDKPNTHPSSILTKL